MKEKDKVQEILIMTQLIPKMSFEPTTMHCMAIKQSIPDTKDAEMRLAIGPNRTATMTMFGEETRRGITRILFTLCLMTQTQPSPHLDQRLQAGIDAEANFGPTR